MRKLLLSAAAMLLVLATPAKADLVISDLIFRDLGGTGFGVAPRLLSVQGTMGSTFEAGATIAGAGGTTQFVTGTGITFDATARGFSFGSTCTSNGTCAGTLVNQSNVFSVATLGWTSGSQVGIGLDTNETGSTDGLQFNALVLTLYDAAGNVLGHFSGDGPVFISQTLLDFQQGNGNSVFDIRLDAPQQAQYDAIIAAYGASNVYAGLAASFGCLTAGCLGSITDGAESFLAFQAGGTAVVPAPIAGGGVPGLIMGMLGLFGLQRYRRRRSA
jgi:hypothetical protein